MSVHACCALLAMAGRPAAVRAPPVCTTARRRSRGGAHAAALPPLPAAAADRPHLPQRRHGSLQAQVSAPSPLCMHRPLLLAHTRVPCRAWAAHTAASLSVPPPARPRRGLVPPPSAAAQGGPRPVLCEHLLQGRHPLQHLCLLQVPDGGRPAVRQRETRGRRAEGKRGWGSGRRRPALFAGRPAAPPSHLQHIPIHAGCRRCTPTPTRVAPSAASCS